MNRRIKAIHFFSLLVWLPYGLLAQTGSLVTSARSVDTGKVRVDAAGKTELKEPVELKDALMLPLLGEHSKTAEQIEWEVRFLNECDQNFASRVEASQFFSSRGWEYVAEQQLDTAIYRFNLAWVLSDKNPDTYWGLGVVTYQQGKLPESIRLLKKGLEVADTNAVLMTDLATVELKLYKEHPDAVLLTEAMTWLTKSLEYDSTNANAYMHLSWGNYIQRDYGKAWDYFHKARTIDRTSIDLPYLRDLLAKQPDPQGVFK